MKRQVPVSPLSKQRLELVRTWIKVVYFCCIFCCKAGKNQKGIESKVLILDRCSAVRKQIFLGFV